MPFTILERSLVPIYMLVFEAIMSPDGIGLMPDQMI